MAKRSRLGEDRSPDTDDTPQKSRRAQRGKQPERGNNDAEAGSWKNRSPKAEGRDAPSPSVGQTGVGARIKRKGRCEERGGLGEANGRREHQQQQADGMSDGEASGAESCSSSESRARPKRKRRKQDDEGYEGPMEEDGDSGDERSPGEDGSNEDESDVDDSDDDIKLDGALTKEDDGDSDPGIGQEEADKQTVVEVSLDFCDPDQKYFHGVRALLANSYLQDALGPGLTLLVDLAMAQGAVGTVLSTDGEDDSVFGFITTLPLDFLAERNQYVKALLTYLRDKAKKAGRSADMQAVLGEDAKGKVGLLINERMINCPVQAVPKLHEALVEDIAWAVDNEISEEHRDKFRFEHIVIIAPCDEGGNGQPTAKGQPAMLSDFCFFKFDDEVLLQEADFFFPMTCPNGGSSASGNGAASSTAANSSAGHQRYIVGVVPAENLARCVQDIAQLVG